MDTMYTFKHVIFALRKEYLAIEKQLQELKKYVSVSDNVQDYYFHIAGDPCQLFLFLYKRKNLLEKMQVMLGTYIYGKNNYNVTDGILSTYLDSKKEIATIDNLDEVNDKIKQIVESDFFKSIVANHHVSIPCIENNTNSLLIAPFGIELLNGINNSYPHFDYCAYDDSISVRNMGKPVCFDDIFDILSLRLDSKFLNDYHCHVLEEYEDKEIQVDDHFDSDDVKFEIVEDAKKIVLKPKTIIK